MTHRTRPRTRAFGVVVLLFAATAAPQAAAVRDGPPITVEVSSMDEFRAAAARATPGSIIRIAAGTFAMTADDPLVRIKGLQGSPDRPIVIQGTRGAAGSRPTIIDGGRSIDATLGMIERFRQPEGRTPELDALIRESQYRTRAAVNCLALEDAAYLVIEEFTIRNCWPTAVIFLSSHHITLRANTIVGSTYAIFLARGSDHFVVEDSIWTQDDSGYTADESGYSGRYDTKPKPGRMWDTVPWGVSHHGSRAYLNGSLISSFDTRGDIIVRHNIIRNAYNGVRISAKNCKQPQCNVNVEIYDNDFQFNRDNPVEPETQAINWWIHHNRIYDAHGWFSLDGVGGGPVYIWGNVGWFDDKPARECIPAMWAADRTLQADGSYAPTAENGCSRSRTGKVIKLGPGETELSEPIYVFNNSWYVRAPVVDGGVGKFRVWNNATLFCDPNAIAPGMCVAEYETEKNCVQAPPGTTDGVPNRFPLGLDRVPFVDCIGVNPGDSGSHGISNHPDYPDKLAALGYPVSGFHGDPGFVNGTKGDFRLRSDSLARGKGCTVIRAADGSLACPELPGPAPDIGAFQGDALVEGPDYLHRGDDRPRIMKATWRKNADSMLLEIAFSTLMRNPPARTRIAVRIDNDVTVQSEPCDLARGVALACRFPMLRASPGAAATLLVPRSLASATGQPVTLWASGAQRVEFQR
ncbi:MAG TPA: hypothetical protein VFJ68_01495 [Casimicrobiaceae bacterium]|nr:hypothetical protein [Casimicrobiaceae bacterium]